MFGFIRIFQVIGFSLAILYPVVGIEHYGQEEFLRPTESNRGYVLRVCRLTVPKTIMTGSASFTLRYSFQSDADGKPIEINRLIGDYVAEKDVVACIKQWRFYPEKEKDRFVASFRWEHGEGWTKIIVIGPRVNHVIEIEDGIGY